MGEKVGLGSQAKRHLFKGGELPFRHCTHKQRDEMNRMAAAKQQHPETGFTELTAKLFSGALLCCEPSSSE